MFRNLSRHRFVIVLMGIALLSGTISAPSHAAKKPTKSAAPADPSIPPKDARWTLYCQAIGGLAHIEQANAAKVELVKLTGWKDWYVIHQEGQSVVYFGFYRSVDDARDKKETERAQRDRKQIAALADPAGNKVFVQPLFVEVSSPDPNAPPEWNLLNADGYWSLQIAAYKDSMQRKQAAVEAVRAARAQGVPAYYYHGETTSSVCIGIWPRGAVKEQDESAAVTNDPTQDLLVLPQPLTENFQIRNRQGERVKAMAPRFEPTDPSLQAAIEQYTTHAVNGEVRTRTIDGKVVEDPSFLVVIPRPKPSLLRAEQPAPQLLSPTGPEAPAGGTGGAGKLKSIGD